jgi:hypothetical protein
MTLRVIETVGRVKKKISGVEIVMSSIATILTKKQIRCTEYMSTKHNRFTVSTKRKNYIYRLNLDYIFTQKWYSILHHRFNYKSVLLLHK